MSDSIHPKGEGLRKAVKWISDTRQDDPDRGMSDLIDEAGRRFNLTPRDQSMLVSYLIDNPIEVPKKET